MAGGNETKTSALGKKKKKQNWECPPEDANFQSPDGEEKFQSLVICCQKKKNKPKNTKTPQKSHFPVGISKKIR